jgi:hypothetical protein
MWEEAAMIHFKTTLWEDQGKSQKHETEEPISHCSLKWTWAILNINQERLVNNNNIVISSQGSIHNGSLLHSRLNTQLLITVHSSSTALAPVWRILELQPNTFTVF